MQRTNKCSCWSVTCCRLGYHTWIRKPKTAKLVQSRGFSGHLSERSLILLENKPLEQSRSRSRSTPAARRFQKGTERPGVKLHEFGPPNHRSPDIPPKTRFCSVFPFSGPFQETTLPQTAALYSASDVFLALCLLVDCLSTSSRRFCSQLAMQLRHVAHPSSALLVNIVLHLVSVNSVPTWSRTWSCSSLLTTFWFSVCSPFCRVRVNTRSLHCYAAVLAASRSLFYLGHRRYHPLRQPFRLSSVQDSRKGTGARERARGHRGRKQ